MNPISYLLVFGLIGGSAYAQVPAEQCRSAFAERWVGVALTGDSVILATKALPDKWWAGESGRDEWRFRVLPVRNTERKVVEFNVSRSGTQANLVFEGGGDKTSDLTQSIDDVSAHPTKKSSASWVPRPRNAVLVSRFNRNASSVSAAQADGTFLETKTASDKEAVSHIY